MSNDGTIADKVPRGLRGLNKKHTLFGGLVSSKPMNATTTGSDLQQLQQEATSIEQWWSQPRWKYTTRTYTGRLYVVHREQAASHLISHEHFSGVFFLLLHVGSNGCCLLTTVHRSTWW